MKFDHYIIVRFFLKRGFKKIADQKEIDYRINIANNFLIKSMNKQTKKNFKMFFLVDPYYKKYDFSKLNLNDNYEIIFLELLPETIRFVNLNNDFLITTRIDSDDFVCHDFIESIQSTFLRNKKECLIDFENVNFIDHKFSKLSTKKYKFNSMFLSTCFKPKNYNEKFCFLTMHSKMKSYFDKKISIDKNCFCLIHGGNILNKITSGKVNNDKDFLQKITKYIKE